MEVLADPAESPEGSQVAESHPEGTLAEDPEVRAGSPVVEARVESLAVAESCLTLA